MKSNFQNLRHEVYFIKSSYSLLSFSLYHTLAFFHYICSYKPGQVFKEGDTRRGNPYYTDENIHRVNTFLKKLKPLADDKKATLSQLVLRWTLEQPGITIALVGARTRLQAIENAGTATIKLSDEEMRFIDTTLQLYSYEN